MCYGIAALAIMFVGILQFIVNIVFVCKRPSRTVSTVPQL